MTSLISTSPAPTHEEIDLIAILRSVWQQKLLLVISTMAFAFLALIFLYFTTPEYEVSTLLRPAALNDLDEINRSKVYRLPPDEALKRVGAALDSYETRLGYFRSVPQLQDSFTKAGQTQEQAFEEFNSKALKIKQADSKNTNSLNSFIGLDMRYPEGLDGKSALNGFVQYAIEVEREKISQDLKVIIRNRIKEIDAKLDAARVDYDANKNSTVAELLERDAINRANLNDELRALRVQLKMRRDNRIEQLKEAISIARSLGIQKPTTPSSMGKSDTVGNIIHTEFTSQQLPLYFMGTDALEAEQRALRKRTTDDFTDSRVAEIKKELLILENNRNVQFLQQRKKDELFLKGIEALRSERARLAAINTDMSDLQLVSIDRRAIDPIDPVWPKKSLFFFLAIIMGGIVGVAIALLRYMVAYRFDLLSKANIDKSLISHEASCIR
ncbi:Wzz/FepE/Etk N-terminal domain-containing protein [Pseudomonas putida]|uniref:Wzz/FepE/Etk N-terminal domain-containing protein n=1 Tax=Pseudomonas putida TaxID=303 RepID=UPI002D1F6ED7|nr:Wzz/FepE/Etk N-terminal domain-containing protein [Pseudomonas putida]MEB3901404.1 Wzz/FepE/Etk N-terminal domain-containing protein [Pseudomonas putida]